MVTKNLTRRLDRYRRIEAPQILDDIDLGFTSRAGKNSRVFCTANEAIIDSLFAQLLKFFNRNSQMTI